MRMPSAPAPADAPRDHPEADEALKAQVREWLAPPAGQVPRISQVFLYDDRGSELYEAITQSEEYYLTRNEHRLLVDQAADISSFPRASAAEEAGDDDAAQVCSGAANTVIELGAGSGLKTRVLLEEAAGQADSTVIYAPIDVSQQALDYNVKEFSDVVGVKIEPILGTVASRLHDAAQLPGRHTWLFLGSSLGNYTDPECVELFSSLARVLGPRDRFLVGVDTPHSEEKPASKIEAAYNDAQGVTADFTVNILAHVNRVADLDFDLTAWRHSAVYDPKKKAIVTHVLCIRDQVLHASDTGQEIRRFAAGDKIFVEQSRKFSYDDMALLAHKSGFLVARSWALEQGRGVAGSKKGDHLLVEFVVDAIERSKERARWIMEDIVGLQNLEQKPVTLRNTFSFYRGHMPAFSDLKAIQTRNPGALPDRKLFREAYERGVDPDVDDPSQCHWHSDGLCKDSVPDNDEFVAYANEVSLALKAQVSLDGDYNEMVLLALEHELMHVETLLYLVAEQRRQSVGSIASDADPLPSSRWLGGVPFKRGVSGSPSVKFARSIVQIPAGLVQLGLARDERQDQGFAWDNESPATTVQVDSFRASSHPVTNSEFAEFVLAGGYSKPELWGGEQSPAWQWVVKTNRSLPELFRSSPEGLISVLPSFHAALPIDSEVGSAPAWVTLDEARAFAVWRGNGARIMSEAEYHRLFGTDETAASRLSAEANFRKAAVRGNNDFRFDSFTPVGSLSDGVPAGGVDGAAQIFDLVGNGWEWTATEFAPFNGFKPLPAYPDYSQDFFDGKHFVLKGAGPFTDSAFVRRSFRNWFQARYPYVTAKFRLVYES